MWITFYKVFGDYKKKSYICIFACKLSEIANGKSQIQKDNEISRKCFVG